MIVWLATLTVLPGCGTDPTGSSVSITLELRTEGAAFDANGYRLAVAGTDVEFRLPLNGTIPYSVPGVVPLTLELKDVAENCFIGGGTTRNLALPIQDVVTYHVVCSAPEELAAARILFVRERPDQVGTDLYQLTLDGSEAIAITDNGFNADPAISPDGQIAFARGPGASFWPPTIHTLDPERTTTSAVTTGGPHLQPSWSPDGNRIAYTAGDGAWSGTIRVVSLESGEAFSLSAPGSGGAEPEWTIDSDPEWSPDGTRIVLHHWKDGRSGINVVRPDDTGWLEVASPGYSPTWSPGSDRIAFQAGAFLRVVRLDDLDSPAVSFHMGGSYGPSDWSHDGRWISITLGQQQQRPDVYLFNVLDGRLLRITLDGRSRSAVFWD